MSVTSFNVKPDLSSNSSCSLAVNVDNCSPLVFELHCLRFNLIATEQISIFKIKKGKAGKPITVADENQRVVTKQTPEFH